MFTVRAYSNNKRVSTGRVMKNGSFFQAYPTHKVFASRDEWMNHWIKQSCASFHEEKVLVPAPAPAPAPAPTLNHTLTPVRVPVAKVSVTTPPPKGAPSSPPPLTRKSVKELDIKDWQVTTAKKFLAPAGTYYIGDICYFLNEKIYDRIFGGKDYESGLYIRKSDNAFFMVDNTAWGDGLYNGSDGFEYGVDAGIIGIVSVDLGPSHEGGEVYGGKLHTFKEPVEMKFGNGIFRFKSNSKYLVIDTAGDRYNSDEDW
jgi:hypothetical protein